MVFPLNFVGGVEPHPVVITMTNKTVKMVRKE